MSRVYPRHSIQNMKLYKTGVPAGTSEQDLLDRAAIVKATPGQDGQGRAPVRDIEAENNGNGVARWTVDRVMDHGQARDGRAYKVLWKGYPASDATWEPESNLTTQIIFDYWEAREAESSRGLPAPRTGAAKRRGIGQRPRGSVTGPTARTVASVQPAEVSAVPVGSIDGHPNASEAPAYLALSPKAFGHAARGRTQRPSELGQTRRNKEKLKSVRTCRYKLLTTVYCYSLP